MKKFMFLMTVIVNGLSILLAYLSATVPGADDSTRPFGIGLGIICWIMSFFILYESRNEKC